ncbi:MAG: MDR family MFS transporter [Pseudomonadota bacterium]
MTAPSVNDESDQSYHQYDRAGRWLVTVSVLMGSIAMVLNATIINVAIPDIMQDLDTGMDTVQLVSTGFLAAMTATMLLNAWLVARIGIRATFLLAVLLFTMASLLGALAPSIELLVMARVLQGAAAGVLQPLAMLVIFRVFPPHRRGFAMGIFGFGVVLAPALGPTVGGVTVEYLGWRYVLLVALPFCIAALYMGRRFLPGRDGEQQAGRFDAPGFVLVCTFLVALLTGLSRAEALGWDSPLVLTALTVALLSGLGFIRREWLVESPLLDLRLFRHRGYVASLVVAFIFGAGIYGSTYLIPLLVQNIRGYSPIESGLLLMPAGFVLAAVFPLSGHLADRYPEYRVLIVGLLLFALSSWLLVHIDLQTSFITLVWWIIVGRIGLGLMLPGLNAGALRALPDLLVSQGTGALNFVRQLGGAIGVNLLALFLHYRSLRHVPELAREGAGVSEEQLRAAATIQGNIPGYQDSFLLVAVICLLAVLPAFWMRPMGQHGQTG